MKRYLAVLRTMMLVVLFANAAWAQTAQSPKVKQSPVETPNRILFVGNSYLYYNDSLHNHVRRLAIAADPASEKLLQYKSATIGGAPLAHHNIQHLLEPGNLGMKQPFEVVVLQDASTSALSDPERASFREKVIEFNAEIVKRGAKTALYMTHAHVKPSKFASPDMIRKIEDMYVSVGNEVAVFVIPVGLAFEEAYRQRPDIKLHKEYDGSHPDLMGTYLAACVVYASLYGKSPVGNSYDYYGKVDKEVAAFLQKVAEQTVRKFFGR
jgi:Domain of unknown function (DUF4886)